MMYIRIEISVTAKATQNGRCLLLSWSVVLDKVRSLPNLGIQKLCPMVEVLRVPIYGLDAFLIRLSIDILYQLPSYAAVAPFRFHKQVAKIDNILDASREWMWVPSDKADKISRI